MRKYRISIRTTREWSSGSEGIDADSAQEAIVTAKEMCDIAGETVDSEVSCVEIIPEALRA